MSGLRGNHTGTTREPREDHAGTCKARHGNRFRAPDLIVYTHARSRGRESGSRAVFYKSPRGPHVVPAWFPCVSRVDRTRQHAQGARMRADTWSSAGSLHGNMLALRATVAVAYMLWRGDGDVLLARNSAPVLLATLMRTHQVHPCVPLQGRGWAWLAGWLQRGPQSMAMSLPLAA